MTLRVFPVTPDRWADMCMLFEQRGPRGGYRNVPAYGCWCMYWRDRSLEHGEPKKRAMAKLVRGGHEPGLLAYDGDEPVGWVSLGPREDFAALLASPQYRPREMGGGDAVWSLVCFTVDRNSQRSGVARKLLAAAVDHAFARGASSLEAYPHKTDRANYMGNVELFDSAGFVPVRETSKRLVMRLER
jgi:ribosomal protein S18 acetylase RimI-like enzyme